MQIEKYILIFDRAYAILVMQYRLRYLDYLHEMLTDQRSYSVSLNQEATTH